MRLKFIAELALNLHLKGDSTMRYMMLVRTAKPGPPPQSFNDAMAKMSEEATKSGQFVGGGMLGGPAMSARVQLANGKVSVVDGPFSEAKEVIGGWAILMANSKEGALRAAREFMELHRKYWPEFEGESEVRPMFEPGKGP